MSPSVLPVPASEPKSFFRFRISGVAGSTLGATISAIAFPSLNTRTDCLVLLTRSRAAEQFLFKSATVISFKASPFRGSAIGKRLDIAESQKPLIRSNQSQVQYLGGRSKKAVDGISVCERQLVRSHDDLVREKRFMNTCATASHPSHWLLMDDNSSPGDQG